MEYYDLEEIKRKIEGLPREEKERILRKFPHLALTDEEFQALVSPEEQARVLREFPGFLARREEPMSAQTKFFSLSDKIAKLCRERGEVPIAEVERMAKEQGIRPTAILDELSIAEGITVDLAEGKIKCR